ncbi:glycosyltransferase family 4 protein [Rhodopila sp.]|uniref:glycosyltransferase family 4 protein n=1 Tax=Rhodopila sp. TaxID=2480087 RepID=UPI003D1418A9
MPPPAVPKALAQSTPLRLWRSLPAGVRRRALAKTTGWLAPKVSPRPTQAANGIVVAGELSRASGMGETARLMAVTAQRLGLPVWTVNVPPPVDARREVEVVASGSAPPLVPLVLHINAPLLPLALLRLPSALVRNRCVIGYWAWELPEVPPEWRPALACVNQVWVPSRFTAAVLEPLLPGRVRVVPPALAVAPPVASELGRAAFDLPQTAVIVLVSFNLASSFARKNPFAAIAAFHGAFGDRADRILLLKVAHADHAPADFARLTRMVRGQNIRLVTETLSPADRHALTACADIVLSLHRGEGFGLVLAEAMLLGKPVVATGWSGNTDFMDGTNAALVGYRLVPTRDDRSVYRGVWAEPDVSEAAGLLRRLADDADLRRDLGRRARAAILDRLDGRALIAALEGLR